MRQSLRAAAAGDDAEVDFRLTESRGLRCNDDVAAHCQFTAATKGETANGSDDRFGDLVDFIAIGEPFLNSFVKRSTLRHFLDVRPGGENFFSARDDDHPNFSVLIELLH